MFAFKPEFVMTVNEIKQVALTCEETSFYGVLKTVKLWFVNYHLRAFVVVLFDKVGFFRNKHFSYSN